MENNVFQYLDEKNISYILHKHSAVFSVAESSANRDIQKIPGLHCKTLFLKDNNGTFYLLGMPAHKKMNSKLLRREIGVKDIRFGSSEELKEKTGLIPGSVSVFGAINSDKDVYLILDKEVWEAEVVGFHPNDNTMTLEIKHANIEKFYKSLKNKKSIVEI